MSTITIHIIETADGKIENHVKNPDEVCTAKELLVADSIQRSIKNAFINLYKDKEFTKKLDSLPPRNDN